LTKNSFWVKIIAMSDDSPKGNTLEKIVPILLILTILLAFVVGVLWQKVSSLENNGTSVQGSQETTAAAPSVSLDQIKDVFKKDVIKFGDENSKVLFVEIADPSCPYCQVASGKNPELNNQVDPSGTFKLVSDGGNYRAPVLEMKKLVDEGKASYALIYSLGHGNGEMGMKALYCGFELGKYWEVNAKIMSNAGYVLMNETVKNDKSKSGEVANFLKGAVDAGKMKACLEDSKWDERLAADMKLASELGSQGTPNFYINDTIFAGAYDFKDMEGIVNSALQ
jgi:protein-disulfide isomerase